MRYRQPMFRLVHISDPHLGPVPDFEFRDYFNKRIFGLLNWKGNRNRFMSARWREELIAEFQKVRPDHIAVTGDVTNLALRLEFLRGRDWLQSLGASGDVSVIPGNHDAYIAGAFARYGDAWAPFMSGDETPGTVAFPYLRRRDGVALIGTTTAVAMPPLLAGGLFGRGQAKRLHAMLSDPALAGDFKIVMIHHPPHSGATARRRSLFDARVFRRAIRSVGADLILHGHTHLPTFAELEGPYGPVPVIGVAAASNGPGASRPAGRYNLFEIERTDGTGEAAWTCRWTERGFNSVSGDLVTFRDRASIDPRIILDPPKLAPMPAAR